MTRKSTRFCLPRGRYSGWGLALVVVLLLLRVVFETQQPSTPEVLPEDAYLVERVVDGDTLQLANGARIRLIGVDTPETVHPRMPVEPFGPEATAFTERFVAEAGGRVQLRFDLERKDQYDRFLAYVYDGERCLNEELVRQGLAEAEPQYNYSQRMKTRLLRIEEEARTARRGLWSQAAR